jgi:hypothetical protein
MSEEGLRVVQIQLIVLYPTIMPNLVKNMTAHLPPPVSAVVTIGDAVEAVENDRSSIDNVTDDKRYHLIYFAF